MRRLPYSVADMADSDPRYPRSSIEDDFNYGSCVASASVHIRMGMSPPHPAPAPPSPPRCCAIGLRRRVSGFTGRGPSGRGWERKRGSPGVQTLLLLAFPLPTLPAPGKRTLRSAGAPGERGCARPAGRAVCAGPETGARTALCGPRCRKGQMEALAAFSWRL